MNLVSSSFNNHVSVLTIHDFENELLKNLGWDNIKTRFSWLPEFTLESISSLLKNIKLNKSFFAVIMDIRTFHKRVFPYLIFNSVDKAVYLFDVWEPLYPQFQKILTKYNFNIIFISSKLSADYFAKVLIIESLLDP